MEGKKKNTRKTKNKFVSSLYREGFQPSKILPKG